MATIQKQRAEKKGRKRFKKLFCQIRNQVVVFSYYYYIRNNGQNFLALTNLFVKCSVWYVCIVWHLSARECVKLIYRLWVGHTMAVSPLLFMPSEPVPMEANTWALQFFLETRVFCLDSSLKWPIMCQATCKTLLTHTLWVVWQGRSGSEVPGLIRPVIHTNKQPVWLMSVCYIC